VKSRGATKLLKSSFVESPEVGRFIYRSKIPERASRFVGLELSRDDLVRLHVHFDEVPACDVEQLIKVLVRAEIPDDVQVFYDAGIHPGAGRATRETCG
jgi:hypothetical protein